MKPETSHISKKKYQRVLENMDREAVEYICPMHGLYQSLDVATDISIGLSVTYCKYTHGWFYYAKSDYISEVTQYVRSKVPPATDLVPLATLKYKGFSTEEELVLRASFLPKTIFNKRR